MVSLSNHPLRAAKKHMVFSKTISTEEFKAGRWLLGKHAIIQIMSWEVNLFTTNRGEKPVSSFILELDATTKAKVANLLDLLEQYGPKLGMPHSKKMSRDLYELRIRGKIEVRIFYTFKNNQIYLLHAFQKKSQKTPRRELEVAESRLELLG